MVCQILCQIFDSPFINSLFVVGFVGIVVIVGFVRFVRFVGFVEVRLRGRCVASRTMCGFSDDLRSWLFDELGLGGARMDDSIKGGTIKTRKSQELKHKAQTLCVTLLS